ncbi:UNKNOWN [Stylonychia lemnae]|uniref:Uncharacterized protein n=1 Tax=Stylonychia lemnae TaxID=5949 RepID=A0A078AL32_STYLE|nr:UNKNOWN [Stylonychia lemnae]|eukprot:CDW82142.1 UNKNOWN [Stylonychia lemnae]
MQINQEEYLEIKEDNIGFTDDNRKDPSQLEQVIFSSEKKQSPKNNFLNLSSKQSSSFRDMNSGFSIGKMRQETRMSREHKHNWRQMLTPHQMNDISQNDYNTNRDITRPSQSPIQRILGTDQSSSKGEEFQTHDLSDGGCFVGEGLNNMKSFKSEEEELKDSIISYRIMNSQRNVMSINSNLRSMLQTLKGNELQFFQDLERKYFQNAQKRDNSSSPSLQSNLQHSDSNIIDQIEGISQASESRSFIERQGQNTSRFQDQESANEIQDRDQERHEKYGVQFNLQNYFKEFNDQKQQQKLNLLQQNSQYQGSIREEDQDSNQYEGSPLMSEFNLSPGIARRRFDDRNLSPPLTSQIFQSSDSSNPVLISNQDTLGTNSQVQPSQSLNQHKQQLNIDLEQLKKDYEQNLKASEELHKQQVTMVEEDVLQTYRNNCEMARQFVHSTNQQQTSKSFNSQVENNNFIILSKSESSRNNTPDVYQTAKWNNIAQIGESFQNTINNHNNLKESQTKQIVESQLSNNEKIIFDHRQLESQRSSNYQSTGSRNGNGQQVISFNQSSSNRNIYLFEENVELKNYLKRAYQCVVKFLNCTDQSKLNSDMINELQIFAELEQRKKDWIFENQQKHFNQQNLLNIREGQEYESSQESQKQFLTKSSNEGQQMQRQQNKENHSNSRNHQHNFSHPVQSLSRKEKDQGMLNNQIQTYEIQSQQHDSNNNNTPQQQFYEVQSINEESQASSIKSNLSGIKQNLKETKKSLLQAKKLLFQEKCINIDHEKQIQDLHSQMDNIKSQVKQLEQQSFQQVNHPMSYMQSQDYSNYINGFNRQNFMSGIYSPMNQMQTTQCSNCQKSTQCTNQKSVSFPYSPIFMGTFSKNASTLNKKQKRSKFSQDDSFLTQKDDSRNEENEYSFLKDEAELLMSEKSKQKTLTLQSPTHFRHDTFQMPNFSDKKSEYTETKLKDLESVNTKLKQQIEDNIRTFTTIQQQLDDKECELKKCFDLITQQKSQIQTLKTQLKSTNNSLQCLIENQKQQEDLLLEQIQKFNHGQEELVTIKQHYHDCRNQLEYFKSRYESFTREAQNQSRNSSTCTLVQHSSEKKPMNQGSHHYLLMTPSEQKMIITNNLSTKAQTKEQQNSYSYNQNDSQRDLLNNHIISERSSKAGSMFLNSVNRAPGTIHHQKRNTASFSSPSEFQPGANGYDEYEAIVVTDGDCENEYQSESIRKFQEIRNKVNAKFGQISQLIQDKHQSNDMHYLRNQDYQLQQYQDDQNRQSNIMVDGVQSQLRVLSATDLEFFNSITQNQMLREIPSSRQSQGFSTGSQGIKMSNRRSPTVIVHDQYSDKENLSNAMYYEGRLQNSSLLKYSGDTFV